MKYLIIISLFTLSTNSFCQKHIWNDKQLEKYFTLNTYQATILIQDRDSTLLFIYPALKTSSNDDISKYIKSKENRFQYLLANRTTFENIYNSLYPDTFKIRSKYANDLAKNKLFINYLNETIKPFQTKKLEPKLIFSKDEAIKIAARFFYSDSLFADTSISMHICVGLNGVKDVRWNRDYTLLEAFCFEAIFYYLKEGEMSVVEKNFKSIVRKLKNEYLHKNKTTNGLLKYIQTNTFQEMGKDKILIERIFDYYEMNKSNLSFRIERLIKKE
jgi:hypothetical protein